jgi:hypothetical protein
MKTGYGLAKGNFQTFLQYVVLHNNKEIIEIVSTYFRPRYVNPPVASNLLLLRYVMDFFLVNPSLGLFP